MVRILALCVMIILAASALGQTFSDLVAKYPVVTAYEARPGILLTAKYDAAGQVCEAALEKRHLTARGVDLGSTIPNELTKQLVDEVIPVPQRGKRVGPFNKWDYVTTISGNLIKKEALYEKVAIEINGTLATSEPGDLVVTVRWKRSTCPGGWPK